MIICLITQMKITNYRFSSLFSFFLLIEKQNNVYVPNEDFPVISPYVCVYITFILLIWSKSAM